MYPHKLVHGAGLGQDVKCWNHQCHDGRLHMNSIVYQEQCSLGVRPKNPSYHGLSAVEVDLLPYADLDRLLVMLPGVYD